jgi:hypothetical protein
MAAAVAATVCLVTIVIAEPADAETRGLTLATPGTAQPVTFNEVVGGAVFFSTDEALTGDPDSSTDIYRWSDGAATSVTAGAPALDVTFNAVVRDGAMVVGSRLDNGHLRIFRYVGQGEQPVNHTTGEEDSFFKASSPDGDAIAFETAENTLGSDDTNGSVDVFVDYFDPVTPGPPTQVVLTPSTAQDAHFAGGSTNLRSVVYRTDEALSPDDHNAATDLYGEGDVWGGPGFSLLSDGVGAADTFDAIATNGTAIVYTTSDNNSQPWNNDTDGQEDVYWSMGLGGDLRSGGTAPAAYAGSTPGLEATFYSTAAQLDPSDTDSAADVYVEDPGGLHVLVTPGSADLDAHLLDVSTTGDVVFETSESLSLGADPGGRDLYTLDDATNPVLLSGSGPGDVTFGGVTDDDDVYFTSPDRLTAADTDDAQDVYVNEGGTITLVSGGSANVPASFEGVNADGTLAVFSTTEQLTPADTDAVADLYTFGPVTPAPPPPPPDTTPPEGTATGKTQKNDGRIEIAFTCGSAEECTATAFGTLTVPTVAARGQKMFTLKGATVTVAAGAKATLKLRVPKKAKKAAAGALKAGRKVKAKVSVVIADSSGNRRTVKVTLKLK